MFQNKKLKKMESELRKLSDELLDYKNKCNNLIKGEDHIRDRIEVICFKQDYPNGKIERVECLAHYFLSDTGLKQYHNYMYSYVYCSEIKKVILFTSDCIFPVESFSIKISKDNSMCQILNKITDEKFYIDMKNDLLIEMPEEFEVIEKKE